MLGKASRCKLSRLRSIPFGTSCASEDGVRGGGGERRVIVDRDGGGEKAMEAL